MARSPIYFLTLLLAACFVLPSAAYGQSASSDSQKRELIMHLLEVNGSFTLRRQMFDQIIAMEKQGQTPDIQAQIDQQAAQMDFAELTDKTVDIYARHFTTEEIQSLISFYESPAGKKYISELPSIMQESLIVAQQWGENMRQTFNDKFKPKN